MTSDEIIDLVEMVVLVAVLVNILLNAGVAALLPRLSEVFYGDRLPGFFAGLLWICSARLLPQWDTTTTAAGLIVFCLLAVPDLVIAEIINGDLRTQPRPASRHARAASSLGGELYGPFERGKGGPGGWILLDEPELHLGGDSAAANVGFQKGDIILAVNNQKIGKTGDLEKAAKEQSRLWRITLVRGGQQINVTLGG